MDFLFKNRSPENLSGKRKDKKLKKRTSSAMSPGLDKTLDDSFEGNTHGKKKKKSGALSAMGVMSPNSGDVFENKKHSKKNSLSSAAPELSESFVELGGKLQEKKKKQKKKLLSALDTELNESVLDATEGKKKKKKRSSIPDEIGLSQESLVNMAGSPPKRKKKKSEGQENLSMSETQEGGLDSPFKHRPDITPKHKKKKGKVDEVTDSVKSPKEEVYKSSPLNVKKSNKKARLSLHGKESSNLEGTPKKNGYVESNEQCWAVEEELSLIDSVLGNLDPKDNAPFRTTLRKIDWKSVAIKGRTPRDCSDMLNIMISKISKYKTLAMILQEAKEEVSDSSSRLRRILPPRLRFIHKYCKKHKSEAPSSVLRSKASTAWLELSGKEKKRYELEYAKEVEEIKKTLDLPPGSPRGPFELYYASEIEKGGSKGMELKNKCRKLFSDMKIEEKSQYIHESCQEASRCISEYKSYKESHPDFDKPMPKISGRKLYKEYFEFLGMPKCLNSVVGIFFDEMNRKGKLDHVDAKNKLVTANVMFGSLSDEEKTKYKIKCRKALLRYNQLYDEWKESLNSDVALVLETYFENKPKGQEGQFGANHTVEVSMAKPKFNDEPEKPAPTPFRLFGIKFRKQRKDKYSSTKEMEKACAAAWKSLPAESHSKYLERCQENREIYKDNLLEYVRNLGDVAKVYLGFKRKEHHRFFKEDIFEEEFPIKDYPIYVIAKKEVGTLQGVVKSRALSEEGIKELKVMGMEHSKESSESGGESSDEDSSVSDHKLEKSVPKQKELQRTPAKESISDDEDDESSDEDASDSDHELEKSLPKQGGLQRTPAKESSSEDEDDDGDDDDDDDDDNCNVTQAWESPKDWVG
ncbi:nucleolar transcription factor 1-A-like isoform X2 [Macrobrachium nipponense]|uniref:nucleolar transcription factor 1-A-like isoform X2 n=1 Tax=Macrobrachium nipponense TaxID=159736 RepID=UPI0030C8AAE2